MERDGTSVVLADIREERCRQMHAEGWTPEHDDGHSGGEMAMAAACYALPNDLRDIRHGELGKYTFIPPQPRMWPWSGSWWKPKDRRRDLIRAAALIVAEIERLDRKSNSNT